MQPEGLCFPSLSLLSGLSSLIVFSIISLEPPPFLPKLFVPGPCSPPNLHAIHGQTP